MDDLDPIPGNLRALLEEEKSGGDPSSDARERVLLRLAGTFALGGPGGLPTAADPATAGSSHVASAAALGPTASVVRAVAIFVIGAAAGAGGYHLVERAHHHPAPVSAPVAAPVARPELTPPPEMAKPEPPPVPEPVPPVSGTPIRPRSPATVETKQEPAERSDDPLSAERSLLEMARAALTRGQAGRALSALRRHARQFPNGELTEEREGLLVQALVGDQKYDQAREKAEQFRKRYPRSLFAPVVDQAIGSIP
jgi:hypothetical protein